MTEDPSFSPQAQSLSLTPSNRSASSPEWRSNYADAGLISARSGRESRIVIIERELLIRELLARCVEDTNSADNNTYNYTVELFATVAEWINACATRSLPSLILLCAVGRSFSGAEIESDLAALSGSPRTAPVAILSDEDYVNRMQATFELGARGYVPMNMPLDGALSALRIIEVGGTFVPASSLIEFRTRSASANRRLEPRTAMLTATQVAVGEALRQRKSNKQIAHELDMGESTVNPEHHEEAVRKRTARMWPLG
jgi:DNA-binding NarL/FixJ family response regulator